MPRILGVVLALVPAVLVMPAGGALANHVRCGDVITQDTTLDSDLVDCPGDGIVIDAAGITLDLSGHVVDGDGVRGGDPCEAGIRNVSLCSGREPAHDDVTIKNGTVREFRAGVHADGVARSVVRGLVVTSTDAAIDMRHSADVVIESSRVVGNEYGIVLNEVTGARVERNQLSDNSASSVYGIDADGVRIERNRALGNGGGFDLVSGVNGLVTLNQVEDNATLGILIQDGVTGNRILRNRVSGNGDAGIVVFEGTRRNRIEENVVANNGNVPAFHYFDGGIVVDKDTRVERNSVSHNSRGIVVWGHGQNTVLANRVFGNHEGIVLEAGEGDRVEDNRVSANQHAGIHLLGWADSSLVRGNAVARNGLDGILVEPGVPDKQNRAGHAVSGNLAAGNGDDGIDVEDQGTVVSANVARRNSDLGIEAVPGITDGGGNRAFANRNPLQCLNVVCR